MIVSYYIKTESGDSYLYTGWFDSVEDLKESLMEEIEMFNPMCEYKFNIYEGTSKQKKQVDKVFQEFYEETWKYGEED